MSDAKILQMFEDMYHMDRRVVDKMSWECAQPHNIYSEWVKFARKQMNTLNLMVIPRISTGKTAGVIEMVDRIEDTINNYEAVEHMLMSTGVCRVHMELVCHAHEYIQNNNDWCGRTTEFNMFSNLLEVGKYL